MKQVGFAAICAGALLWAGCSGRGNVDKKLADALAAAKQDRWEDAARHAAAAASAAPRAVSPMLFQALAYERNGEFDKALDLARRCAALAPEDFTVQYTFGRLSAADPMRRSEAFSILENALRLRPGDRNTLVLLCNLGAELASPRVGTYINQLRTDREFSNSTPFFFQYGLLRARQGDRKQSLLFLQHAVRLDQGRNARLILNAARCLDRYQIKPREAAEMYRSYLGHPDAKKNPAASREAQARLAALRR